MKKAIKDMPMSPKRALILVIFVAAAVFIAACVSSRESGSRAVPAPVDADLAVQAAMQNYLHGYSLAQSGFVPALSTSTPACSGPLVLNASVDGRVAVFGKSCELPGTYLCQEMSAAPSGPKLSPMVAVSASSIAPDRFACE